MPGLLLAMRSFLATPHISCDEGHSGKPGVFKITGHPARFHSSGAVA